MLSLSVIALSLMGFTGVDGIISSHLSWLLTAPGLGVPVRAVRIPRSAIIQLTVTVSEFSLEVGAYVVSCLLLQTNFR